jgi:Ca-activated chloride channel family protein
MGRLVESVVERIVRQHFGQFRLCFEARGATGTVSVRFVIDRDGSVLTVAPDTSTVSDPLVVACIVHGFEVLSFPAPEGGQVNVTYALAFDP